MPYASDGSFQRLHNWAAHSSANRALEPALLDAEHADFKRAFEDILRQVHGLLIVTLGQHIMDADCVSPRNGA